MLKLLMTSGEKIRIQKSTLMQSKENSPNVLARQRSPPRPECTPTKPLPADLEEFSLLKENDAEYSQDFRFSMHKVPSTSKIERKWNNFFSPVEKHNARLDKDYLNVPILSSLKKKKDQGR